MKPNEDIIPPSWIQDLEILERQRDTKPDDQEETDVDDDLLQLEGIHHVLLETGVLLEYLANPVFCTTTGKRERKAIMKHLEKLYVISDTVEEMIQELKEDEDEDPDE